MYYFLLLNKLCIISYFNLFLSFLLVFYLFSFIFTFFIKLYDLDKYFTK